MTDRLSQSSDFASLDFVDVRSMQKETQLDLIVIGSGPAGQKAAIFAAKAGARVALVEREPMAGGVCLNTGTIPSKSLREAVMYLTGYRQRGYYGEKFRLKDKVSAGDLYDRTNHVITLERAAINEQLISNNVMSIIGRGVVRGPHEVGVVLGQQEFTYKANRILIAVGTKTRRPSDLAFDDDNLFDSDRVFGRDNELRPLPDSMIVLGAGVIGIEYCTMFAALDVPTILVDPRPVPMGFIDSDIAEILYDSLRKSGCRLIFGQNYKKIDVLETAKGATGRVNVELDGGETISADACLFAMGRTPATAELGLVEVGVVMDKRGYVIVDEKYRTSIPSIYAAGDVIGFPSLASTSAEQGRVAAADALGLPFTTNEESIPYGIYTIPEISMVGKTEEKLKEENEGYFIGTALWRDTARGKILGDRTGAMKLIFATSDNRLLGVHCIGEGATEILHIGQAVMHFGGGVDYFLETVFNYPTLAEAYKIAAHNAVNRLHGRARHVAPLVEQVREAAFADT